MSKRERPLQMKGSPAGGQALEENLLAVALTFDGRSTPTVSAVGQRDLARVMRKVARRYGVPVCSNQQLASALSELEANQEIPEELYESVAGLLYQLER